MKHLSASVAAALHVLGACAPAPAPDNTAGVLIDVTAESGIDFVHRHCGSGRKYLVEIVAGGVCLLDYDGDGLLDVLFGQGAPLPGFVDAGADLRDRLYRNLGGLRFADVTEESGASEDGYTLAVCAPDYDGDGDQDLYFCNFRRNRMLRNDGGRFTDVTEDVGLGSERFTSAAAFADFDADGDLDVYLCNYVIDDLNHPGCGDLHRGPEYRTYCEPGVFPGSHDQMFRNDAGVFTEVTAEAGMRDADGNGLGLAISDYDDDGDVDLFVANDQLPNFLWRNEGGLRFVDAAVPAGVAVGGDGTSQACMGTDWADVEGDGDFDLITANLVLEPNSLYVNEGGGYFTERSKISGLGIPSLPMVGFGCEFFDGDLDGDQDLMVVNGQVIDNVHLYQPLESFPQSPQFFRNLGGCRFEEIGTRAGAYFADRYVGRGLAVGDLDGDGDQDVVVSNNNTAAHVLENQMSLGRSWIGLRLHGAGKNTAGIGARVTVEAGGRTLVEEVRGTSSYAAFHDLRLTFGLDRLDRAERVSVRWPRGDVTTLGPLDAGRYHEVREEDAAPAARR